MPNRLLLGFSFLLIFGACTGARALDHQAPVVGTSATPATLPAQPTLTNDPCVMNGVAFCWLNADVNQATLATTICKTGWTATIRPPVSYTSGLKAQQLVGGTNVRNGDRDPKHYEEDHRMPLELGGASSDVKNLTPEFADDPLLNSPTHNRKDVDENAFKHRVCSGEPLRQAQAEFVAKWLAPWPAYKATV